MGEFRNDNARRGSRDEDFCREVRRCLLADVQEDKRKKEKERERSRRKRCSCRR
jgi:hypothetical protein